MPLKYRIIEDRKLVYVTGEGDITFPELMSHIEELARDPGYKAPMKKLVDYRNATLNEISMKESDIFTQRKASLCDVFAGEQCAIVAPRDADFGMSRSHNAKIERSNVNTSVFRNLDDALKWLDVKLDPAEFTGD